MVMAFWLLYVLITSDILSLMLHLWKGHMNQGYMNYHIFPHFPVQSALRVRQSNPARKICPDVLT